MGFQTLRSVERLLAGPAVMAPTVDAFLDRIALLVCGLDELGGIDPSVLERLKPNVAILVGERLRYRMLAVSPLRAIDVGERSNW